MLFRRLRNSSTPAAVAAEPAPTTGAASALDADATPAEALAILDAAIGRTPDDGVLHYRRGTTLYRWGRIREARDALLRAAALGVADEDLFRQIGWSHLWTSDLGGARHWMARAAEFAPGSWKAQFALGAMAQAGGRSDDAIALFKHAIELEPLSADAWNCLVICHLDRQDVAGAESAARRAVEIDARQPMAWANLGVALGRQHRFDEARAPFERALELEESTGEVVDSFVNYCNCLRDSGDMAAAIALYERMLPARPNVNAHGDYAFALLTAGRLPEGWREYQFRWMTNAFLSRYPGFDRPAWTGQELAGRTILLWVEQGFGDTLQFIRYAPLVKALGATVFVVARQGLERLLQGCAGIDRIVSRDEPLPPFDFHCPLLDLPFVFGTGLDAIPAVTPYLHAEPQSVARWAARLPRTSKRRVGIVWAGSPSHPNDFYRSLSLEQLRPVLETEGIQFVSLQKGPLTGQIGALPPNVDIVDLGQELDDFSDTLAVVAQLDLVICVDTSVAHLAGGLGKPLWVLLPYPADFRWLQDREDSPWYPSARLFRQDARRNWDEVVQRMAGALQQWVAGGAVASPIRAAAVHSGARTTRPRSPDDIFAAHRRGFCGVARVRFGIMQYFPEEPVEGASLALYGEYRQAQLDLIRTLLAPGSTAMEVGAGAGSHSIDLARMLGPSGHLLALEPRATLCRVLAQNLSANGVLNATLLCRGLAAQAAPGVANALANLDVALTGRVPDTHGASDTLDGMRLQHLDLLKINDSADVAEIFGGGGETLWRLRPRLFVSVGDAQELEAACRRAREFGYRCWRHESRLFSPVNFNLREDDVFLGRTVLAMVAIPEEEDAEGPGEGCTEVT